MHDANLSKIVKHLPRTLNGAQGGSLDDASFDVILAGRFTSAQDLLTRKRHTISAKRLRSFFSFLKAQNICYSGDDEVDLNETTVERLHDWTDHVSQDKSHERADMDDEKSEAEKPVELSDEMTSDRCNIRRRCDDMVANTPEEELHVDVTASILQTFNGNLQPFEVTTITRENLKNDDDATLVIRQQGPFVHYKLPRKLAMMFPRLFPYGRGDPDEYREIKLSFLECVNLYKGFRLVNFKWIIVSFYTRMIFRA